MTYLVEGQRDDGRWREVARLEDRDDALVAFKALCQAQRHQGYRLLDGVGIVLWEWPRDAAKLNL